MGNHEIRSIDHPLGPRRYEAMTKRAEVSEAQTTKNPLVLSTRPKPHNHPKLRIIHIQYIQYTYFFQRKSVSIPPPWYPLAPSLPSPGWAQPWHVTCGTAAVCKSQERRGMLVI